MYRHPWTDLHGIIEDLLDGWVIQDVILAGIRRESLTVALKSEGDIPYGCPANQQL